MTPKQEFDDHGNHRLINTAGQTTRWADYSTFTYLDGWIGVTDYYTGTGERVISPLEFCHLAGVGVGVEKLKA